MARNAPLSIDVQPVRFLEYPPKCCYECLRRLVPHPDMEHSLVESTGWLSDLPFLSSSYGFKTIEFEKGKAGIALQSKEKLVGVIDTLIAAVRSGELDG